MLKKSVIYIFLLFSFHINSQTIKVSEDLNLRNDYAYDIIGEFGEHTLLYRDKVSEIEVQAFTKDLRTDWVKSIDLFGKQPKVYELNTYQDSFYIFYKYRNKGKNNYAVNRYDGAANFRDSTVLKEFNGLFFPPDLEMSFSEDRSKALFFYFEKQKFVNIVSFDCSTMKVLWDGSIDLKFFNEYDDYWHIELDNDGNIYFVIERDNLRSKKKDHHYELHEINIVDNQHRQYEVPLGENLTYDVILKYDNLNHALVGAGLYSEKNVSRVNGYFYINIPSNTPEKSLVEFTPFDDGFVSNLDGKKVEASKGILDLSIQDIVLRRDGGALLLIERNKLYERRTGVTAPALRGVSPRLTNSGDNFIVDYYFDEVAVVAIHPTGETHWKKILHKKQYSQDDFGIYSSYFVFKTPRTLRIIYNDEIKEDNTVSEYVMNGVGDYKRNSLLSTKDLDIKLRFRDAFQIDGNRIIVPSQRRSKLRLVRFDF